MKNNNCSITPIFGEDYTAIRIENDKYKVRINYLGDNYQFSLKEKNFDRNDFVCHVMAKEPALKFSFDLVNPTYLAGITLSDYIFIRDNEFEDFASKLLDAKKMIDIIKEIFNEYFPGVLSEA
jgi:hypothetical protein